MRVEHTMHRDSVSDARVVNPFEPHPAAAGPALASGIHCGTDSVPESESPLGSRSELRMEVRNQSS